MANNIVTNSLIAKEAVALFRNTNSFLKNVSRPYESYFGKDMQGNKIGDTINVRLPNDQIVNDGAQFKSESIIERTVPLTISHRKHVGMSFSEQERKLKISDFSDRYIAPAVNNLVGTVAADVMNVSNFSANMIANFDSNGNTISPSINTWNTSKAILEAYSAPKANRMAIVDPMSMANTASESAGLFNPMNTISRVNRDGEVTDQLFGIQKWATDQTTIVAERGSYDSKATATGAISQINSGVQSTISGIQSPLTSVVSVSAINGSLNVGDVITFTGVKGVNPVTKLTTVSDKQFTVTQAAPSGSTSVIVSPAVIGPNVDANGNVTQASYQTVSKLPTSGTPMVLYGKAGEAYRRNFVFCKEAATLACPPFPSDFNKGVVDSGTASYDGISMRSLTFFDGYNDVRNTRLDIMYGYAILRPEWFVIVCDKV